MPSIALTIQRKNKITRRLDFLSSLSSFLFNFLAPKEDIADSPGDGT